MKNSIGYLGSWGLYYLGDFTSTVMDKIKVWSLYPIYNWCMTRSSDLQDWSEIDNGPWKEVVNENE